jgi:hypothetical protein
MLSPPARPRAGRIEEETRLARSVELVAQRRKIEGHLRAQSKAVKVRKLTGYRVGMKTSMGIKYEMMSPAVHFMSLQ